MTIDQNRKNEVQKVFEKFDTDKNGILDVQETKKALKCLSGEENYLIQPTDEEIKTIIGSVDSNSDGCLNFGEFQRCGRKLKKS